MLGTINVFSGNRSLLNILVVLFLVACCFVALRLSAVFCLVLLLPFFLIVWFTKVDNLQYRILQGIASYADFLFVIDKNGLLLYANLEKVLAKYGIVKFAYNNLGEMLLDNIFPDLHILSNALKVNNSTPELLNIPGFEIKKFTLAGKEYFIIKSSNVDILGMMSKEIPYFVTRNDDNSICYCNEKMGSMASLDENAISNPECCGNVIKIVGKERVLGKSLFRSLVEVCNKIFTTYTYCNNGFKYHMIDPYFFDTAADFFWEDCLSIMPLPVFAINPDGFVVKGNVEFSKLVFGNTSMPPETVNVSDVFENPLDLKQQINTALLGKERVQTQTSIKNKLMSFVLHAYKNSSHNHNYPIMCFLSDVTEQKNLEANFIHSQKMQAIGQLSGGIAHDFNNLLTAMIGFCDLLLMRHPKGDPSFADIMQIKQNVNRAANLVRQLLALSRKQVLQPKIINITEVLSELSYLVKRLIGEDIELSIENGKDLYSIKVDQGQLEQVLINIIVNARDAMNYAGCIKIRTHNVTVQQGDLWIKKYFNPNNEEQVRPGEYLMIELADSGVGIEADDIGKIFDPFFSKKNTGVGMGLGLSTAYGIIKQTGGYMLVHSIVNCGTTFVVLLPKVIEDRVPAKIEENKRTEQDLTGNESILVVEDEANVRSLVANILRNKGYNVMTADSGGQAVEVFNNMPKIDVLITDVAMPGIKGTELMLQIKKINPRVKVILMSGYAANNLEDENLNGHEFIFLAKPFTFSDLGMAVKQLLEQKNVRIGM